jgi:uncharacterized surface protein with fasciclin (FAS1) repeats
MKNRIINISVALLLSIFIFNACDDDDPTPVTPTEPDIVDIASDNENFSVLTDALVQTGLTDALAGPGPFTVFAPTDEAFAPVSEVVAGLSEDQLTDVLEYHVLAAQVASTDLQPEQIVSGLNDEDLFITFSDGTVSINNGAVVADADIMASNGIIHAVDGVLLPDAYGTLVDNAQKRYFLTELVNAVVDAGLAETLSDPDAEYTVFAPTNEAFEAIADVAADLTPEELADILLYHVVEGSIESGDLQPSQTVTTLNGAEITITSGDEGAFINGDTEITRVDAVGTNGVFHVIDSVLLPPEE